MKSNNTMILPGYGNRNKVTAIMLREGERGGGGGRGERERAGPTKCNDQWDKCKQQRQNQHETQDKYLVKSCDKCTSRA